MQMLTKTRAKPLPVVATRMQTKNTSYSLVSQTQGLEDKEEDDVLHRCSFIPADTYVIGCRLPMSSSLSFFHSCFRHRSRWRRSVPFRKGTVYSDCTYIKYIMSVLFSKVCKNVLQFYEGWYDLCALSFFLSLHKGPVYAYFYTQM